MNLMKKSLALSIFIWTLLGAWGSHPAAFSDENSSSSPMVKAVEVSGNRTVSNLTVLAKIKSQPDTVLSSAVLNEDLKRLYGLGFFSDVRIEQEDYLGGVKLVFVVVEKPVLADVIVEGARKIKGDQIKKEMTSTKGDFVDQKKVRDDLEKIRALYEKKGFSGAKVDYALENDPNLGQASLKIIIDEGQKLRIKDIRVTGNDNIASGDILKRIKTKKSSFFGFIASGYLKEEDLSEDAERIKAYYDEAGFSDVEVATSTETVAGAKDDGDILLNIEIQEGKKYLVGEVNFSGNSIVNSEELLETITMKTGQPFSRRALRVDVSAIQDLYFEKGYLSAQVRSESLYNQETERVDLAYSLTENELTYVERVLVQGNTKTKDIVIRRELRAYPGESFSGAKLKRSKERLYNLGYFEDVKFDTENGTLPNSKDLLVSVKEAKTGEFSFGGGYSSIDSVLGFVQIRQRNFDWQNWNSFTGAGQDFAVRFEAGGVRQNAELSFTEPWAFGHPYSLGFDLFRKDIDRSGNSGYFYDQTRTGGDIRLGKEFNEFDRGLLMYKIEEVQISDIRENASQALRDEVGTNVTSSLQLTLTRDHRDNVFNPTKGYLLQGTGEYAGGFLAGDRDFWKLGGMASGYYKNFDTMVLELKIRAGISDEHGDSRTVPIYERFFAGGAGTIRGYRERRVGPRDLGNGDPIGGEAYWVANAEETFPIYPNLIKGAVFYDIGSVDAQLDDFGGSDVAQGIGAGVRVKTPIGPVKLDVGYPLDDVYDEKKKLRFYFNISQGF